MITRQNTTEFEPHKVFAEHSDLGLRPGDWPESFETDLGNGQPFLRHSKTVVDGDLMWVTYFQANGCIRLRVYND